MAMLASLICGDGEIGNTIGNSKKKAEVLVRLDNKNVRSKGERAASMRGKETVGRARASLQGPEKKEKRIFLREEFLFGRKKEQWLGDKGRRKLENGRLIPIENKKPC